MRELSEATGIEIEERNFQKDALTEVELRELIALPGAGGVAGVISRRNKAVKEAGWADNPPQVDAFVAAAASDNKMIRRPILVLDDHVVVGNDADGIRAAFEG